MTAAVIASSINSRDPGVDTVLLTAPATSSTYDSQKFQQVGAVDYTFNGTAGAADGYAFTISGNTVTMVLNAGGTARDIWLYVYPNK